MERDLVFISYAREDLSTALRIYSDLRRIGLKVWLDAKDLVPGQDWRKTISRSIKDSSYFIALLSSKSLSKRGYVQKELKIALGILEEFPAEETFIIPVRLDPCTPLDDRLEALHWIDLFESYTVAINKIHKTIIRSKNSNLSREKDFLLINKGGNKSYFSTYATDILDEPELFNLSVNELGKYAVIYKEWSKEDIDYDDYLNNMPKILEYIMLGGIAVLNIASNCGDQDSISPLNVHYRALISNEEFFVEPNHPYLTGKGYGGEALSPDDFYGWDFTDHGYLVNVPSFSTVILKNIDGPSLIEFYLGQGAIIISTITFGCCTPKSFDPGAPLSNLINYSRYLASSFGG